MYGFHTIRLQNRHSGGRWVIDEASPDRSENEPKL